MGVRSATSPLSRALAADLAKPIVDGPAPVVACAFPLDADETEVQAAGADQRLTMSGGDQAFALTLAAGGGSVVAAAFPADTLSGTGQQVDVSAGIVAAGALRVTSFPLHAAADDGPELSLTLYSADFSKVNTILLTAKADGTALLQVFGTGISSVDTTLATPPDLVGLYFDAGTGQVGYVLDGVDQGYIGAYTGTNRVPMVQVTAPAGLDAAYDAETVSGEWVTAAADLGTGLPAGTTDPCANPV